MFTVSSHRRATGNVSLCSFRPTLVLTLAVATPAQPAPSAHLHGLRSAHKANDRCSYESLKKVDLEAALDRYLTQNATTFASDPKLAGFFQSQAKARGSPVKRESTDDAAKPLRVARRRTTRAPEDLSPE